MKYLLPAFVWGLVILIATSSPIHKPEPPWYWIQWFIKNIPHFDKLIHFFLFAVWGFLLRFGFHKQKSESIFQKYSTLFVVLLGLTYGILTELFQHYYIKGRHGDYLDVIADLFGTVFGVFIAQFIQRKFFRLFA